jgi:hypothetical protein
MAGVAGLAAGPVEPPEPYARVVASVGTVSLFPPGDGKMVAVGNLPVLPGTLVKTGSGRAEIDVPAGATVRLSEASEAKMRLEDASWEVKLRKGQLELEAWAAHGAPPAVETEFGTVHAHCRTVFSLTSLGDGAILDVRHGIVEVRGRSFATMITAPSRLILRPGTPLFAPPAPTGATGRLRDDFIAWSSMRRAERSLWDASPATTAGAYLLELASQGAIVEVAGGARGWAPAEPGPMPRGGGEIREVAERRIWVPREPWAWATTHYGSWFPEGDRWIWIPGAEFHDEPSILDGPPAHVAPHGFWNMAP